MTLAGVVLGLAGGLAVTRLMGSLLFGVGRWDVTTFVTAPGLLLLVAALAIYFPARRATRVDPIVALREE